MVNKRLSIKLPAPGKINLFLHILQQRPDGYHELQTAFQFIDLCDWVTIETRNDPQVLRKTNYEFIAEKDDLTIIAAKKFLRFINEKQGINLTIVKNLPIGAGIGGGSSNAATVLIGLNHLYGNPLSGDELIQFGLDLGADVPIFITMQAAVAEGVGEKLTAVEFEEKPIVLVKPDCAISTQELFNHPKLSRNNDLINFYDYSWKTIQQHARNDFETIVLEEFSPVLTAFNWLKNYGVPRLTGTGSCLFLVCGSEIKAKQICEQAPKGMQCWPTHLKNRSALADYL